MGRFRDFFMPPLRTIEPPLNRAEFGFNSSEPVPNWAQWSNGTHTDAGVRVNARSAYGIPAYLRGVRLISETIAAMPITVKQGDAIVSTPSILRFPVPREAPVPISAFDTWSFWIGSAISWGNGYLLKVRAGGRLVALMPLDPSRVQVRHTATGAHEFWLTDEKGHRRKLDASDILQLPGIHTDKACCGESVIAANADRLGIQLARQQFEGRYLANDATPSVVLKHPGQPNEQQRKDIRNGWDSRLAGSANKGKTGTLWGGWEADFVPVNMRDAQFIEASKLGIADVALMLGLPGGLLGVENAPGADSVDQENTRLLSYGLMPWITRFRLALLGDVDVFPSEDSDMELDAEAMLRLDALTQAEVDHRRRQSGVVTGNEVRKRLGLPDHADGDVLQQTPVGGLSNNDSPSSSESA